MDERRREADEREETASDLLDFGMSVFGSACAGMFFPFLTSNKTHTSTCLPESAPPGGQNTRSENAGVLPA